MNNIKPIEFVEFIYKNQNQQFNYSWYYYYKLICIDKDKFTSFGALLSMFVFVSFSYRIIDCLEKYFLHR